MSKANDEDLRVARDVIETEFGKRGTTGLEAQIGRQLDKLEIRFATALTAARAETWKEAIAIVKYADAKANWPLKEGSLIKALEAAAGSTEAEDRKAAVIRRGKE